MTRTINDLLENDDSLNEEILYQRLKEAYYQHDRLQIAYDLDDTVRRYRSSSCDGVVATIKLVRKILKPILIVYTANTNLEKNWLWLKENKMPYDSINTYPPDGYIGKFQDDTEGCKIYYNLFLDDKTFGLKSACAALLRLCEEVSPECTKL